MQLKRSGRADCHVGIWCSDCKPLVYSFIYYDLEPGPWQENLPCKIKGPYRDCHPCRLSALSTLRRCTRPSGSGSSNKLWLGDSGCLIGDAVFATAT